MANESVDIQWNDDFVIPNLLENSDFPRVLSAAKELLSEEIY